MTIKGIRKAVGESRHSNFTRGGRLQISLNLETGELLTAYHVGENLTVYHDPSIVHVVTIDRPITAVELDQMIDATICVVLDEMYN